MSFIAEYCNSFHNIGLDTGLLLLGAVGQMVGLTSFISTFGGTGGVYFVVFFCSALFVFVFGIPMMIKYWRGLISWKTITTIHWQFILLGLFDGLNGLLTVYSSAFDRVPGPLQPILVQFLIPFSLLFSYFFFKNWHYDTGEIVSALVVLVGIMISLIPNFVSIHDNGMNLTNALYPILMIVGTAPAAMMNIVQQSAMKNIKDVNIIVMLFWESVFQVMTVGFFFWTDFTIPGFGTSKSFSEFSNNFNDGVKCFFGSGRGHCQYSALIGIIFSLAYSLSYYYTAVVIRHTSANTTTIVSSLAVPISVIFWFAIPPYTKWVSGESPSVMDIVSSIGSIPFIFLGAIAFKYYEGQSKKFNQNDEVKTPLVDSMV